MTTDSNDDIRSGWKGRFVAAGDPGFDDAVHSRVFNRRRPTDRLPVAVLQAADVDDVVRGVRLAHERGWSVTTRAGGHSWIVWSVQNDALLVDLAAFAAIDYDDVTGIVSAGPAVRGGSDLDPVLAAHGRFFNGGHCPTVGIGGFLLQGGMGWNCRGWGWATESVVAVDVVTASGEVLRCDAEQNSDLYWAARGAGPAFPGVVVTFHLQTRPRYTALTSSMQIYPAAVAPEVLAWMHETRWDLDDSVELVMVNLDAATLPFLDYEGPVLVVDGLSFAPTAEEGRAALAPLETSPYLGQAMFHVTAAPADMEELRERQTNANPENHFYVSEGAYLVGGTAELISAITPAFTTLPTTKSFAIWFDMGRAPQRALPDMALSLQSDIYFAAYLVGEDDADVRAATSWITDRIAELEPVKSGTYLGDSDLISRPAKFMSDEAYARLNKIRECRDPAGIFPTYLHAPDVPINQNPWEV
ncbi:FAD-binding oxidoreductase [Nocardioides sp. NPDC101246]|uniref:FAD-binding oxidoreductase n=1 Tax=Nocardioides sp. NPDC101246 TaxID=3364336 RepID=UPI0038309CED